MTALNFALHILSQVNSVNNLPSSSASIPVSGVLKVLESARQRVLKERLWNGLHAEDFDKRRREKFEITSAKIHAIGLVEDSILDLAMTGHLSPAAPVADDLEGILSYCERMHGFHSSEARKFSVDDGMPDKERYHLDCREIYRNLLSQFSGSAGTQPLTSEETPEPTGTFPVTAPASNPRSLATLSEAFPDGGLPDWLASLPTANVEAISEAALSALENRGAVVHWSLTGA